MPYITKDDQRKFAVLTTDILASRISTPGELNYLITCLAIRYMQCHDMRYEHMNAVVGALDSAKEEFRRRVMNPYETQKAFESSQEDGDPYETIV